MVSTRDIRVGNSNFSKSMSNVREPLLFLTYKHMVNALILSIQRENNLTNKDKWYKAYYEGMSSISLELGKGGRVRLDSRFVKMVI